MFNLVGEGDGVEFWFAGGEWVAIEAVVNFAAMVGAVFDCDDVGVFGRDEDSVTRACMAVLHGPELGTHRFAFFDDALAIGPGAMTGAGGEGGVGEVHGDVVFGADGHNEKSFLTHRETWIAKIAKLKKILRTLTQIWKQTLEAFSVFS